MTRDEKIAEATRLRAEGLSYAKIGAALGVSSRTAQFWLDPEIYARHQAKQRERCKTEEYRAAARRRSKLPRYRAIRKKYDATRRGQINRSLAMSRSAAKQCNHAPCDASIDDVVVTLTESCEICGVSVTTLGRRLCLDHNHTTGEFRGWLCDACNISLGKMQDEHSRLRAAARYLERRTPWTLDVQGF